MSKSMCGDRTDVSSVILMYVLLLPDGYVSKSSKNGSDEVANALRFEDLVKLGSTARVDEFSSTNLIKTGPIVIDVVCCWNVLAATIILLP